MQFTSLKTCKFYSSTKSQLAVHTAIDGTWILLLEFNSREVSCAFLDNKPEALVLEMVMESTLYRASLLKGFQLKL
ncbi:unnamed protein product [Urochloa humidicola]